jgi:hypothetical protein
MCIYIYISIYGIQRRGWPWHEMKPRGAQFGNAARCGQPTAKTGSGRALWVGANRMFSAMKDCKMRGALHCVILCLKFPKIPKFLLVYGDDASRFGHH